MYLKNSVYFNALVPNKDKEVLEIFRIRQTYQQRDSSYTRSIVSFSMRRTHTITIATTLIIITMYSFSLCNPLSLPIYAQQDLPLMKSKNLQIELDDNLTTNAQLTYPVVGQGPYPGILLISGSGANDMNETAGFIRINEITDLDYPYFWFSQAFLLKDCLHWPKFFSCGGPPCASAGMIGK